MEILTWSRPTSPVGAKPEIVAEYLLNERGIFVKREKRMPKKAGLTALTGFRIGYAAIPSGDYRAAPLDRNAILWHKISRIMTPPPGCVGGTMMTGVMIPTCPWSTWSPWKGTPSALLNRRFWKKPGCPGFAIMLAS